MKRNTIYSETAEMRSIELFTEGLSKYAMLQIRGGEGDQNDDPIEDPIIKEDK